MRVAFILALLAMGIDTPAQSDWTMAPSVEVTLSSFKYAPRAIHLKADKPVVLRLVNTSSGGHDFTAPEFFAAATVRTQDRGAIEDGSVEVTPRRSVDIALVPKAGRYPLKCSHSFHKMFGMSGEIIVR